MTLEELNIKFPDEISCRKYLSFLRWGKWARCPYCDNEKSYILEGKAQCYKCANKECHKKYSVTVKSLMEDTKISMKQWILAAWMYSKKRGKMFSWDLEKTCEISFKTAASMKDKFDFVWKYIDLDVHVDADDLMEVLLRYMFHYYAHKEQIKESMYKKNYWHVQDVDNISDPKQYSKLCTYIKVRMMWCKWIFIDFATPQDVMANLFLYLSDNNIKEYSTDFIIKKINLTIQKMWMEWVAAHPNILRYYHAYGKEWKRKWRLNLKDSYVAERISTNKEFRDLLLSEIKANKSLIKEYREKLKRRREASGKLFDWQSHFD